LLYRPAQRHVVREPDRQGAMRQRVGRRQEPAIDGEAALAVELLPRGEIALGGRHGGAAETGGAACRFTAPAGAGHRDAALEPAEVKRLVPSGVAARLLGDQPVFGEAAANIL